MPTVRLLGSTRMAILSKTATSVKHDGTRRLHDLLANLLSKWLRRAKITHMGGVGGYKHTSKGLFTEFVNQLTKLDPRNPAHTADLLYRQGIYREAKAEPARVMELELPHMPRMRTRI